MKTERPWLKPSECQICGKIYQQAFLVREIILEPHTPNERTEYRKCPKCGFHPQLMNDIYDIIVRKTVITLTIGQPPQINGDDVATFIQKKLKETWPIPSSRSRSAK